MSDDAHDLTTHAADLAHAIKESTSIRVDETAELRRTVKILRRALRVAAVFAVAFWAITLWLLVSVDGRATHASKRADQQAVAAKATDQVVLNLVKVFTGCTTVTIPAGPSTSQCELKALSQLHKAQVQLQKVIDP